MKAADFIQLFLSRVSPEAILHAEGGYTALLGGASGIVFAMSELFEAGLVKRDQVELWLGALADYQKHPLAVHFPDFKPTKLANGHMSGPLSTTFAHAYAGVALGNADIARASTRQFVEGARALLVDSEPKLRELWGGTAGLIVVTDVLAEKLGKLPTGSADAEIQSLKALRDDCSADLLEVMKIPFADRGNNALGLAYLGMAHGFAGELYGALLASDSPSDFLIARLDELAALATREDNLIAWPTHIGGEIPPPLWSSYCNGAPGMLELWATAYEKTQRKEYLELARLAAETTFGLLTPVASLCCGVAGQGVALVRYGERCDDPKAVDRGKRRIRRTFELGCPEPGLMKGDAGLALIALDVMQRKPLRIPLVNAPL